MLPWAEGGIRPGTCGRVAGTTRPGCCGGCPCGGCMRPGGWRPAEFSLIHMFTNILALSLATGSAAVMTTALPPPGWLFWSMLICAPLSVANFLMVPPWAPMSLETSCAGQTMLLSTQLPAPAAAASTWFTPPGATGAAPGSFGFTGSMAVTACPGACAGGCVMSLIRSLKFLSIWAFFSAMTFQSMFSLLFASAVFLQSLATWPLSPQMVHTTLAIL
mmetsp:Transcript_71291/g.220304  ORF Transcript_71291/g.220304 Transcript_71291/m.220304 type:complete len:218 (-) Transcript_71291:785-1438(-)